MSDPKRCGHACQFIAPDYPRLERQVHGDSRNFTKADELFFGPHQSIYRAELKAPLQGAQWTGITTRIAERLLEEKMVDAVLTMAAHPDDPWRPLPVIITKAKEMARARGMRMGYAPLLALLEPAYNAGHRRVAVIGIPCQVYALRALEKELGFEKIYVIGTPCSDNTTTERFHEFLNLISDEPQEVSYLEFCADYHVEMRFKNGTKKRIPFLMLPLSELSADFFPLTCRSCVDYTNVLADITVGYMGGEGKQWVLVRNDTGKMLLSLLKDEVRLSAPESAGRRAGPVRGFLKNTERAAGGLPLRKMPQWLRPIVGWLMPRIGPRGMEFARARIEMKAIESIIHLRREEPRRMKNMIPSHVWEIARPYGLTASENPESPEKKPGQ